VKERKEKKNLQTQAGLSISLDFFKRRWKWPAARLAF
jgi:hypothetical protein